MNKETHVMFHASRALLIKKPMRKPIECPVKQSLFPIVVIAAIGCFFLFLGLPLEAARFSKIPIDNQTAPDCIIRIEDAPSPTRPVPQNELTEEMAPQPPPSVEFFMFTPQTMQQLRRGFYERRFRKNIPNRVRDELMAQRHTHKGVEFSLSPRQILSDTLLQATVFLPQSTHGFLALGCLDASLRVGILDRHIFLFDTQTRQVHHVLYDFLIH